MDTARRSNADFHARGFLRVVVLVVVAVALLVAAVANSAPAYAGGGGGGEDSPVALTGDPRDADPCALLDATEFSRFGATRIAPGFLLSGCDVRIDDAEGRESRVSVAFEAPGDAAVPRGVGERRGALTVLRGPAESVEGRRRCDTVLLLSDGNGVRVSSSDVVGRTEDLCALTATAEVGAARALARDGVTYRPARTDQYGIAASDACALADPSTLAVVPGLDSGRRVPRFGNWVCAWGSESTGQPRATVALRLDDPGYATYGAPTTIAGKAAFTEFRRGAYNSGQCTAWVVHDLAATATDQTEILSVTVDRAGAPSSVCDQAIQVATDIEARLAAR